jgi:glyoxalase family protein
VTGCGFDITPPLDRYYFRAIYFRTPCGLTFAVATDTPGFAIEDKRSDVEVELSLPPWLEPKRAVIERRLGKRPVRAGRSVAAKQIIETGRPLREIGDG